MARSSFVAKKSETIHSADINTAYASINNIENTLDIKTKSATGLVMQTKPYINADGTSDNNRYYELQVADRSWAGTPIIKKNGATITTGFDIVQNNAILFYSANSPSDTITVDAVMISAGSQALENLEFLLEQEENARKQADGDLQVKINNEITNRTNADTKIRSDLLDGTLVPKLSTNSVNLPPDDLGRVNPYGRKGNAALGLASIGLGYDCIATAERSIAIGPDAMASQTKSIAIGPAANATGGFSTAIGNSASATGQSSSAFGYGSLATGAYSTALGLNSKAKVEGAIAINGTADGIDSIAIGGVANALDSMALNGSANGISSTALGDGANTSTTDSNTIQLGSTSTLSNLYARVALQLRSDERDKTDIVPISKALDFIKKVETIQYVDNLREKYITDEQRKNDENFKKYGMCNYDKAAHTSGTKKGTRKRVGVKAQQVQQVMSDVFGSADYGNIVSDNFFDLKAKGEYPPVENKLTIAYTNFIPFLIKAIQEQQSMIDTLQKEVMTLKSR